MLPILRALSNLWEKKSTDDEASESNNNDFVLPSFLGTCLPKGKVGLLFSDEVAGLRNEKIESPSSGADCSGECSIFLCLMIVDNGHNLSSLHQLRLRWIGECRYDEEEAVDKMLEIYSKERSQRMLKRRERWWEKDAVEDGLRLRKWARFCFLLKGGKSSRTQDLPRRPAQPLKSSKCTKDLGNF